MSEKTHKLAPKRPLKSRKNAHKTAQKQVLIHQNAKTEQKTLLGCRKTGSLFFAGFYLYFAILAVFNL
ncbi:MAG: hypothetical protein ACOX7I_07705 [Oscillospiraceae bacterium]|jgi:hypothetical protein